MLSISRGSCLSVVSGLLAGMAGLLAKTGLDGSFLVTAGVPGWLVTAARAGLLGLTVLANMAMLATYTRAMGLCQTAVEARQGWRG